MNGFRFRSLDTSARYLSIIAIDLGYSARSKSCGVARIGNDGYEQLRFGDATSLVGSLLSFGLDFCLTSYTKSGLSLKT